MEALELLLQLSEGVLKVAKLVNRLREMRERAGLTQFQVGDRLNVSHSTVLRWESGETPVTIARIRELAQIYKCEELELVTDIEAIAVDEKEKELLALARNLDPAARALVLGVVQSMHKPAG